VLRQTARAVQEALALPKPATERDEVTYLRCVRDRARLVWQAMQDILNDPGIEDDPRDVMVILVSLTEEAADLGDKSPFHTPEPTL
jgi:hypothetical protein